MSFVLRSHRDRNRKRARESFYRSLAVLSCLGAAMIVGYVGGQRKQAQEIRQLNQKSSELIEQVKRNENQTESISSNYQTLRIKYNQLIEQYKRDVPQGEVATLTALVREQLDKGLAVERMAQIIRAAQPPQNCSAPMNKRFILSTPVYTGPESVVTFADGLVTVKGVGEPSINSKKEKEAWYDPGKPVTITFTIIGGKKEDKKGLLPLHHTIIHKNKEYRFTISEGPRSFVSVASDSCDYIEDVMAPVATPQLTSEIDSSM